MKTVGKGPLASSLGRYTRVANRTPSATGTICLPSPRKPYFAGDILGPFQAATVVNPSKPRRTITMSALGSIPAISSLFGPKTKSIGREAFRLFHRVALRLAPATVASSSLVRS